MELKLKYFFILSVFLFLVKFSTAQNYSVEQDIVLKRLSSEGKNNLIKKGFSSCTINGTTYSLHKNEGNRIGLKVFENYISPDKPIIYTFIESELLKFILNSDIERESRRREEGVTIYFAENFKNFTLLKNASDINRVIQDTIRIVLNIENFTYLVTIANLKGDRLGIKFPAVCSLIMEMDKKELVDNLIFQLSYYKKNEVEFETNYNTYNLVKEGNLLVSRGDKYLIQNMKSDLYYLNEHDSLKPLFKSEYTSQSFSNLLLMPSSFSSKRELNLKIKEYGDTYKNIKMNLNDFLTYFNSDFKAYFGIEDTSSTHLRGTLILYNSRLNYIHLIDLITTKTDLFDSLGIIKGTLYAYIPTHDIKSLIDESQ